MTVVDEEVKFKIGADGAERAAQLLGELNKQLGGTSAALTNTAASAAKVNATFPQIAQQTERASRNMASFQTVAQKGATVIGSLTGAARSLSPELGNLAGGIGKAGAAFGALGGVLAGGGPLAVGLALAVGGVQLLSGWFAESKQKAQELADALEKDVAKRAAEAADRVAQSRALVDAALAPRVSASEAKRAEAALAGEAYERLSRKGSLTRAEQKEMFRSRQASGVLSAQADELAAEEANARDRAELERALAMHDVPDTRGGGSGSGSARAASGAEDDPFLVQQRRAETQRRLAALDAQTAGGTGVSAAKIKEAEAAKRAELESEFALQRAHSDAIIEDAKRRDEELARIDEEAHRRQEKMREMGVAGFEMVGSAGIRSLQGLAKGQKVTAKAVLSGVGDELVGKGTVWLFEGIARGFTSYGLDPTATALIGTGTSAIAAGIAMGAATRGGGGGGGGGGGRGGGRSNAVSPAVAPSKTTGAQNPTVVNVHMPTVVSPSAQDGARVTLAVAEAKRAGLI